MDDLTQKEKELIEMIRLLKKSKHNPSKELKRYVRELFEEMIDYKEPPFGEALKNASYYGKD